MALVDDYSALFDSNTGNLLVKHANGYFYVIGEIVIFKCPKLKDELKATIHDFKELDWSHLSEQAVKSFFQYLYYQAKFDKFNGKQFIEIYDLAVKYMLKRQVDKKELYLFDDLIVQFSSLCTDPFEVLELTRDRADRLYITALQKVQELFRHCMTKDCCFDQLNPGTDCRPKDYTSYVCCEHSNPLLLATRIPGWRPAGFNHNLDIVTTPLFHNAKVICYHYTANGHLLPANIETCLCCKHGDMKKIKTQNYERFMKLPLELKKAVWKGVTPDIVEKADATKEKTDEEDDMVFVLTEDAKP